MKKLLVVPLLTIAALSSGHDAYAGMQEHYLRVSGALVTVKQDEALVWDVRWIVAPEEASTHHGVVRLATPLPAGETLVPRAGLEALTEDGHIVGVRVDDPATPGVARLRRNDDIDDMNDRRMISATFLQPNHTPHGRLGPPVADSAAIQIIDADLGGGARLELDRNRALDRRVAQAAREEAVRLTGYVPQPSDTALYLRGTDVRAAGGLEGSIVTIGERTARMSAIVAVVFGLIVAALVAAWRSVRGAAAAERADAILAEKIEQL